MRRRISSRASLWMSLACPRAEPDGWCSMMRVLGSAYRLPCRARSPGLGAPTPSAAGTGRHARPAWRTHLRCAPVPALVPQSVTGRNYCMHLARLAGTLSASTRRRGARERPGRSPRPAQASMQPTPIPACSGRIHAGRACARAREQGAAARGARLRAHGQHEAAHAHACAEADGAHVAADVLHGVEQRQAGHHLRVRSRI